jgi:hypothetical protein
MVDRSLIKSGKTVEVWLPPGSSSNGWKAYFQEPEHSYQVRIENMTESMLAQSLLPYEKPPIYTCPRAWRLPPTYLKEKVPERFRPDIEHTESSAGSSKGGKQ